ncbi:MAG: ATP-binding protein [Patescibacteria group bacterium]
MIVKKNTSSLKNIFEAVGVGILCCDSTGKVLEANAAARQLLAFEPKRLASARDFFAESIPLDEEIFTDENAYLDQLVASRIPHTFYPFQFMYHRQSITYLVSATKTLQSGERRSIITFYDVSKLYEHKSAQELFVRSFAHELKQPLSLMKACIYYLQRSSEKKSVEKYSNQLNDQINLITQMIQDIVDATRFSLNAFSLDKKNIVVVPLLRKSIDNFKAMYPSRMIIMHVDKKIDETILVVSADEARLLQVFNNLLSNAEKYSEVQHQINVVISKEADSVKIDCIDQGIGIPEELQEKIFEPYVRTRNARKKGKGLGLGLSLVKNIITRHGGQITVKSNQPTGSIFSILLPLSR